MSVDKKPLRTKFVVLEEKEGPIPEEQLNKVLLLNYCISNEIIMSLPYNIKLGLYKKLLMDEEKKTQKEDIN